MLARTGILVVVAVALGCTERPVPRAPSGEVVELGAGPRVFFTREPTGIFNSLDLLGREVVPMRDGSVAILGGELNTPRSAPDWRAYPSIEGIASRVEATRRIAYLADVEYSPHPMRNARDDRRALYEFHGPIRRRSLPDEELQDANPQTPVITSVLYAEYRRCTIPLIRERDCREWKGDFAVVIDESRPPAGRVWVDGRGPGGRVHAQVLPTTTVYVWLVDPAPARLLWRSRVEDARSALGGAPASARFEIRGTLPTHSDGEDGRQPPRYSVTLLAETATQPTAHDVSSFEAWSDYLESLPSHGARTVEQGRGSDAAGLGGR